ncbi:MAG TPA: DEDD exonuclease domain-containing protein [Acidimicrobiia bacterium]|jgi:DNA polymerase-3 subunit epsilon|nr:DEDD exonuclease domain-containing protein [Acidimicrobiia bacterium]
MLGTQRTFDDLGAPLHSVPFCVLDLETTGGSPHDCEITEVGAVRYEGGELTGTFSTLVDPGAPIPPSITILTGISQAMVVDAPMIDEVLPSLLEFIGDAVIVGHNVRFDLSFLNAAAVRLGYGRLPNRSSDTAALSRRLLASEVRNFRLATLAKHLRSPTTPNHRALEDAKATAHVFFELLARAGTIGVTYLDDLMTLPTARGAPHYAKLELTEGLPRRPGVYLFRDRNDTVIYVGKAKNLRTRVRSYFYGDKRRRIADMLRDLRRIETRVCPTEVEASITELRLIHAHRPRYNRRSRPAKATHWVRLTREEFPRLSIVRTQRPESALAHLGPFRRKRNAELVMHAIWDAVPIRRCTGTKGHPACRYAQLGVALCPCDGTVDRKLYRSTTDDILMGIDHDAGLLLSPLVDRMRHLATASRFEEAADIRDRHRALARALEQRRVWQAIAGAGLVWAESDAGESVILDHGALVVSWGPGDPTPLVPAGPTAVDLTATPPTMASAEELWVLWRWLNRPGVTIVESTNPVAMPATQVKELTTLAS